MLLLISYAMTVVALIIVLTCYSNLKNEHEQLKARYNHNHIQYQQTIDLYRDQLITYANQQKEKEKIISAELLDAVNYARLKACSEDYTSERFRRYNHLYYTLLRDCN